MQWRAILCEANLSDLIGVRDTKCNEARPDEALVAIGVFCEKPACQQTGAEVPRIEIARLTAARRMTQCKYLEDGAGVIGGNYPGP